MSRLKAISVMSYLATEFVLLSIILALCTHY